MKLDSIIYDVNTLQSALTEKTVDESPVFKAMYPSDTTTSLMNVLAGYGSMLQYSLVSAMANCYTDTVYSETGIHQLAETLGNRLRGNVSSQINIYVSRKSLLGVTGVTIPAHSVWDANGIKFYNPYSVTFLNDNKKAITLMQGEYKTFKSTTNGTTEERIYFSQDFKCNLDTVQVFINGEEWSTTETFLPLNSNNLIDNTEMQSVVLRVDPDGRAYIKFGNNVAGLLPKSGSVVEIQYVENDGEEGNIASDSIEISLVTPIYHYYEGNSVLLDVECENTTVAAGGYNTQSLEVLKETSPYIYASGGRAINREDYKALLINKCGYITCNVWGEYEESVYNGYYDKSMMNTVYYTGIKQLQHYDYRPLGTVNNLEVAGADLLTNPWTETYNIGTIKGFPGSYSIDFVYLLDQNIKMRYRDTFGTGILTCDPSVNDDNNNLFPFNDIGNSLVNPEARVSLAGIDGHEIIFQDYVDESDVPLTDLDTRVENNVPVDVLDKITYTTDINTIFKYNTNDDEPSEGGVKDNYVFIWDGFNRDNRSKNLSFSNPIRIYFTFNPECPTPISAVSFRNPKNDNFWGHLPGKFSLFGTNELPSVAPWDHVRNNINWKKIIDVNKIEFTPNGNENNWTDWFTTNLYQPNKELTDDQLNSEAVVVYDQWQSYSRYVLEIYSYQDESLATFGQYMIIPGIKMLYANNNEDYYAWMYTKHSENVDYKYDWESNIVYMVQATAIYNLEETGNGIQLLVKIDGASDTEYPAKYFPGPEENMRYYYSPAFYMPDSEKIRTYIQRDIYYKSNITDGNSIRYDRDKAKDEVGTEGNAYAWTNNSTTVFTRSAYPSQYDNAYADKNFENISFSIDAYHDESWVADSAFNTQTIEKSRYYRITTTGENLNIHKKSGVSLIDYENNDFVQLCVPAFPTDMKYYSYTTKVTGAGTQNGYKTGERLYCAIDTNDGTGKSYFHVIIQNANADNGNGKTLVYYSKSQNETVTNLPLADNTLLNNEYELISSDESSSGSGAKITISSSPAISIYANMTGNSYTLSDVQRLDEPIIEEYNHFTTYMEFKQPKIKHARVTLNVEYEENVNVGEIEINLRTALAKVFDITPYFLGQTVHVNKIWQAAQQVEGIKRFTVVYPTEDIQCELNELLILNDSDIHINIITPSNYS